MNKFFFRLGNQAKPEAKENSKLLPNETLKTIRYQAWDYNLNQAVMREYSLIVEKPYKKQKEPRTEPLKRQNIQAKILGKHKTNLEHM